MDVGAVDCARGIATACDPVDPKPCDENARKRSKRDVGSDLDYANAYRFPASVS